MAVFSIIVPCYNQEDYIIECLDSVKNQSFLDWECVVVNDGSTDSSLVVIKEYIKNDYRFVLLDQENQGLASSRNNGIKISKGEYVLPLDGDDLIDSEYLSLALNGFKENPNIKLIHCNVQYFGDRNDTMKLENYSYPQILKGNCIVCSSIYKRSDFDNTSGYDSELIYGYEDWDFWLQLLDEESEVFKIEKEVFFYRQRGNSMHSFVHDSFKLNYTMNYIFQKHIDKYSNIFLGRRANNSIDFIREIFEFRTNEINNKTFLLNIKKTLSYKVFVKLESFLRRLKIE